MVDNEPNHFIFKFALLSSFRNLIDTDLRPQVGKNVAKKVKGDQNIELVRMLDKMRRHPWSRLESCYRGLIPSSFCASLKIERSATSLRGTSRSRLPFFLASSMTSRTRDPGSESPSLKTRAELS